MLLDLVPLYLDSRCLYMLVSPWIVHCCCCQATSTKLAHLLQVWWFLGAPKPEQKVEELTGPIVHLQELLSGPGNPQQDSSSDDELLMTSLNLI